MNHNLNIFAETIEYTIEYGIISYPAPEEPVHVYQVKTTFKSVSLEAAKSRATERVEADPRTKHYLNPKFFTEKKYKCWWKPWNDIEVAGSLKHNTCYRETSRSKYENEPIRSRCYLQLTWERNNNLDMN